MRGDGKIKFSSPSVHPGLFQAATLGFEALTHAAPSIIPAPTLCKKLAQGNALGLAANNKFKPCKGETETPSITLIQGVIQNCAALSGLES